MKMTTEQVMGSAIDAAVYFRTLLAEEIPMSVAVTLTGNFVMAVTLSSMNHQKPDMPWDDAPGDEWKGDDNQP